MWAKPTMTPKTEAVYEIINQYVTLACELATRMKEKFEADNLLSAYRDRRIPKSGSLDDSWAFQFHGGGCRFESKDSMVDVEFGHSGRHDLFDAWRVYQFAKHCGSLENVTAEVVAEAIKGLVEVNKVCHVAGEQYMLQAG